MKISLKGLKKRVNEIYWDKMFKNEHYIQIYYGGSSSSKSYSQAQKVVINCLKGHNVLIIRKVASTIRKSVLNEIVSKIHDLKLNHKDRKIFKINKTEMTITNTLTGSQIIFCGADDPEKLKSIVPARGNITDIWLEEATEFSYSDYKAIIKRLRGKSPFKKTITITFNPIIKSHWIYKNFFEGFWCDDGEQYQEKDELSILKTTYKDNKYLADEDIYALENEEDQYYKEVYTYGNWGVLGAVVFKNWTISNFNPDAFSTYRNGLDWGFANDPFAFIRVAVDFSRKKIYVCKEIYEVGLLNNNSSKMVKPLIGREIVYCDCAEPKSIEEYNRYGLKALPAEKGSGSIEEGIKFIKSFELIIHPDCINFQNEIMQYKYKEDKNGVVLPQVVGKNDHLIDALRYALVSDIDQKPASKYSKIIKARINAKLKK